MATIFPSLETLSFHNPQTDHKEMVFGGYSYPAVQTNYPIQLLENSCTYDSVIRLRRPEEGEPQHIPFLNRQAQDETRYEPTDKYKRERQKPGSRYGDRGWHIGKPCLLCGKRLTLENRLSPLRPRHCNACHSLCVRWRYYMDKNEDFYTLIRKEGGPETVALILNEARDKSALERRMNYWKGVGITPAVDRKTYRAINPRQEGVPCSFCKKIKALEDTVENRSTCRKCFNQYSRAGSMGISYKLFGDWAKTHGILFAIAFVDEYQVELSMRKKYGMKWLWRAKGFDRYIPPPEAETYQ